MVPEEQTVTLSQIIDRAVEPVLLPAGFVRDTKRFVWRRVATELEHVIEITKQAGACNVQWGVVSPELVWLLFGTESTAGVGHAALSGTPSGVRHPAPAETFWLDEITDEVALAAAIADDMRVVEQWLRPFQTRADLRHYLMANQDRNDRRGFTVPTHLPLKLYTAAALAVIDRAPVAGELVARATEEFAPFGDDERLTRLQELADRVL